MPISVDKLEGARRLIPNLRLFCDTVVRGGQPDADGVRALHAAGVRTVVSLCGDRPGLASLLGKGAAISADLAEEQQACGQLGVNFVHIPLDVFGTPETQAIDRFVQTITQPSNRPMFVHCQHGRDRTGFMLGLYRIVCDGWTAERAYQEMVANGFDTSRKNLSDVLFAFEKVHAQKERSL